MMTGCGEGPAVRGVNPVWFFVDLAANAFDDSYYMWVLENDVPYIPATIWHDSAETVEWNQPIQFLANGTLPIDIYWDPDKLYRLEFRKNNGLMPPSQTDPLIDLVENYSPNSAPQLPEGGDGITTENLISNPQFSNMSFSGSYTLSSVTNPDPIDIGGGWFLDLVGNGSVTITRIPFNTTLSTPTNAPYALNINLTGSWTQNPVLRQRFQQNGQNWRGKYVSTSLTARKDGVTAPFFVRLDASNGQPLANPLIDDFLIDTFKEFMGRQLVAAYTNLDTPPDAWIDYKVFLPLTGNIYLTSFQLIVSDVDANFQYEQTTVDRQIDHLFHYYKPALDYKPIPSYLVGWDFPMNPAQILGDSVPVQATAVNEGFYAWDQTIVFQTIASSVSVDRSAAGSLVLTCAIGGQIALIQYLDQPTARKILSDRMAVHIDGSTTAAAGLAGSVTLWATDDANTSMLPTTPITALSAAGVPTMGNGVWTQVTNSLQNTAFSLDASVTDESGDIYLNGWDAKGAAIATTANFFCIVVGFAPWVATDTITINSISLCAGDIATRPAPKTFDETLRECEFYYEKSYLSNVLPGAVSLDNALVRDQSAYLEGVNYRLVTGNFSVEYKTIKRTDMPTVDIYNPDTGTIDQVRGFVWGKGSAVPGTGNITVSTLWVPTVSNKCAYYTVAGYNESILENSGAAGGWAAGSIRFHYVVNAQIGVV